MATPVASNAVSGPSSVPFRGSSIAKSQKAPSISARPARSRKSSGSSVSTWILLDVAESSLPFLRTICHVSSGAASLTGASSPAARSSEKVTESTAIPSSSTDQKIPPAATDNSSNVRTQLTKFEQQTLTSTSLDSANEKDRRMSLQASNQPHGSTGSTGKRSGFLSKLRGGTNSISSASAFAASGSQSATLPTSGSWSFLEAPDSIPEGIEAGHRREPGKTIHIVFSTFSSTAAVEGAEELIARAAPMFSSQSQTTPTCNKHIYKKRLDVKDVSQLVQTIRPNGIYIGPGNDAGHVFKLAETLICAPEPGLEHILVEPSAVRRLAPGDAATLYDLAQSNSLSLSLPVRWDALYQATPEETLSVLETFQEARGEAAPLASDTTRSNGTRDPDSSMISVDKSFDVSISNIPTGTSSQEVNLDEVKQLKQQLSQLQSEVKKKDEQISNLLLQRQPLRPLQNQGRVGGMSRDLPSHSVQMEAGTAASRVDDKALPPAPRVATFDAPTTSVSNLPSAPSLPVAWISKAVAASEPLPRSVSIPAKPSTSAAALAAPILANSIDALTTNESASSSATQTLIRTPPAPSPTAISPNAIKSPSSSGKVISSLTAELDETKTLLEATRTALANAKAQAATFQAQAEEMRSTLSRARLENDSSISILARKDRQISEALERARKAEAESKELGRASREWGTRVREVEEELGKERIIRGRAEHSYETLSGEWKTVRVRLIQEVKELRESHAKQLQEMAGEYQKILEFKDKLKSEWDGYGITDTDGTHQQQPQEGSGTQNNNATLGPQSLLKQIEEKNADMQKYIHKEVVPLLQRLKTLEERENKFIFNKVQYVTDELTRIKTLMRRGDVTNPNQIPPAPADT